jgi:hypothetical protein
MLERLAWRAGYVRLFNAIMKQFHAYFDIDHDILWKTAV